MAKTFQDLHPEIVNIIQERGYCTTVYERCKDGKLIEKWEKDKDGVWHNRTQRELNREKSKAMLRKLLADLQKAKKEAEALGYGDD